MTRIVFISDTHGSYNFRIPEGDILIHSGDFGHRGNLSDLKRFHSWFSGQPHQYKIFVAGNHDWCFQNELDDCLKIMSGVTYLQDSSTEILGIKFYGSPWQPWFFDWAFNIPRGPKLAKIWAKIPNDTDILVTHTPPHGILDLTSTGEACGCEDLLKRVETLKPKLHLFGHIHEGYGELCKGATTFINGSICDFNNNAENSPFLIDWEELSSPQD